MTAAALLRSIEPLSVYPLSLKAVYPLLAGLAEAAAAFNAADAAVRAKQDEADLDLLRRCEPGWFANRDALKAAIAALEAAAAKEAM